MQGALECVMMGESEKIKSRKRSERIVSRCVRIV